MKWDDVIVEAAATDTGMRRANNQDSYAVVRASTAEAWKARGHLFMVADGMGAHAVGELASKLACDYIPHTYAKTKGMTTSEALTKAYQEVGAQIYHKAEANPDFHRMGTTCSTLVLQSSGALIAHVGDSRVYRVRGETIEQLSFDHSLVWELVRKGHMKPEQASKAYPKNVITRSLGPEPSVEVDIEGPLPVEPGDVYVLCSDGLSGPVTDREIGAFAAQFHPEDACRYLVHLANLRGGQDNITVVIVRIGPWVEPGSSNGRMEEQTTDSKPKGSLFSSLIGSLRSKPAEPEVEEHVYQTEDCSLAPKLVAGINDVLKNAQAVAVDQTWGLDWAELSKERKAAEAAFSSGQHRDSLKHLAEAATILGTAARLHRKETQKNGH